MDEVQSKEKEKVKVEKEVMKKPDEKKFVRKSHSSLDEKIKKIEASKMPKDQKEEYIAKLRNNPDNKTIIKGINFELYSSIKGFIGMEEVGKREFAKANGKDLLTRKEWDKFFEKF